MSNRDESIRSEPRKEFAPRIVPHAVIFDEEGNVIKRNYDDEGNYIGDKENAPE